MNPVIGRIAYFNVHISQVVGTNLSRACFEATFVKFVLNTGVCIYFLTQQVESFRLEGSGVKLAFAYVEINEHSSIVAQGEKEQLTISVSDLTLALIKDEWKCHYCEQMAMEMYISVSGSVWGTVVLKQVTYENLKQQVPYQMRHFPFMQEEIPLLQWSLL